ncbi:MAG TPA: fumarate reductase/succinate dehydrogenase flavoprotein subunit, partial [Cryomorphaceae bacterium]|nr:fumarate reductase/succinate dehydrogenase flavoprotein subunit [Cryomorphaceae bacterium]
VIPYTIGEYLADEIRTGAIPTDSAEFERAEQEVSDRINHLLTNKGAHSVDHFHKKLGKIMWNKCGMARNAEGLQEAIREIQQLREEFWKDVKVPGSKDELNPELDKALRVADFLELGELMCMDALDRAESAGGHFREEYQTEEGEALRRDDEYAYVAAWEYRGEPKEAQLHKEELKFENIELKTRSYK